MENQASHGAGSDNKRGKKSLASSRSKEKINVPLNKDADESYPKDIPKEFDHYEKFWREELREVMDQGGARTCWTIASTRGLSAQLKIKKKVSSLKYLSALHLLVALYDKTDAKGGLKKLEDLKKFLEEDGAILEKDCKCVDPLVQIKKTKRGGKVKKPILCTHKHEPKSVFKVKELVIIDKVDEEQLIRLVDKGPVAMLTYVFYILHFSFMRTTMTKSDCSNYDEDPLYHFSQYFITISLTTSPNTFFLSQYPYFTGYGTDFSV